MCASSVIVGVADEGVRLKTARTAIVSVAIVPAPEERQLPSVPVRARNLASGLSAKISPSAVKVRVRGTKEAIAKIRDTSIVAYVDLEGIGRGDYGLPVRLEPTADVGIDQLDPYHCQHSRRMTDTHCSELMASEARRARFRSMFRRCGASARRW